MRRPHIPSTGNGAPNNPPNQDTAGRRHQERTMTTETGQTATRMVADHYGEDAARILVRMCLRG